MVVPFVLLCSFLINRVSYIPRSMSTKFLTFCKDLFPLFYSVFQLSDRHSWNPPWTGVAVVKDSVDFRWAITDDDDMKTLGQKMKAARRDRRLSLRGLSTLIGARHQAIAHWESDRCSPRPEYWPAIAEHLGLEIVSVPMSAKRIPAGCQYNQQVPA